VDGEQEAHYEVDVDSFVIKAMMIAGEQVAIVGRQSGRLVKELGLNWRRLLYGCSVGGNDNQNKQQYLLATFSQQITLVLIVCYPTEVTLPPSAQPKMVLD